MSGGKDKDVKETAEEKEVARIGMEKWKRYQEVFVPIENKFIGKITDQKQYRTDAGREASASTQSVFNQVRERLSRSSGGAGLGSGKFAMGSTGGGDATVDALAKVDARNTADDQQVRGLQGALAIGRGQGEDAISGLSDTARIAGADAIDRARADADRREGMGELFGTVAGAGVRYGMGGLNTPAKPGVPIKDRFVQTLPNGQRMPQ